MPFGNSPTAHTSGPFAVENPESSWVRLLSDQPHLFGRTLLRQRTIASGGSHAAVGKPQRKRQKSPQVTDLRFDQQIALAVVSPAVSRVSGAVVSGRTLQSDRFDRGKG